MAEIAQKGHFLALSSDYVEKIKIPHRECFHDGIYLKYLDWNDHHRTSCSLVKAFAFPACFQCPETSRMLVGGYVGR